MASTPVTAGSIIKPSSNGLNNLFARIEALRSAHYTATANAGGSTSGISSAFNTTVSTGQTAQAATVSTLKSNIDAVAASTSFVNNNTNRIATGITVPSVGSLLTASGFNEWNTVITNMEGVCAHYSRYDSHYSGRYDSRYDSHYSGRYDSRYDSHYSGRYDSHYSGRYDSHYSGRYDSHYGRYDHYSGKYGSHYGSHYGHYGHYGHYSHYSSRCSRGCLIDYTKIYKSAKNILELTSVDSIYSYNILNKVYEKDNIINISEHSDISKFIKILLEDNSSIEITDSHPILTTTGWKSLNPYDSIEIHGVYTNLLEVGDYIKGIKEDVRVKSISWKNNINNNKFCNISTQKNHNFLITLNNDNAAIVHNIKVCVDSIC